MKMPQTKILLVALALNGALFAQEVPRDPAAENKPATEPAKQADPAQTNTQTPSSQTPALPDASVQVSLQLVSNSVFRGDDTFKGRAQQKRKQYGTHSGEWMFQPSITFNTPLEGLTFNWVGSFALAGRQDTDVDQRIESGRDGNETTFFDSYYGSIASGSSTAAAFAQARTDLINTFGGVGPVPAATANSFPTRAVADYSIYAPYKEANGLRRLDEMDWTLGYERQTRIGTMGGGLLVQTMSDATGKANPFISGGSGYILTEFFLTYALPQFKDLKLYAGADVIRSDQYYKLTYSHEFPINDSMSVSVNTGPGYMVTQNLQGVRDVPTTVQLNVKGFNVGFNAVYRPKLEFFDTDTATTRAVWLDGGSTKADGLVADPSKYQAGVVSDAINGAITQGYVHDQEIQTTTTCRARSFPTGCTL